MKVIVDVMGADLGPEELVKGTIDAIEEYDIEVILVGDELIIEKALKNTSADIREKIEIINTTEVIGHDEDPVRAMRRKKDSSMIVGANLLKEDKADGFISTGNTGALLASGLFIVGRIKGIERASITIMFPTINGFVLYLDGGANMDTTSKQLFQFAEMASIYAKSALGKTNPTIGLLNVGKEESKGNKLTKETYELLKNSDLNFYGNIEGNDLAQGKTDIVLTDGFVGNITLKLTEGIFMTMMDMLKGILTKSTKNKLAAMMIKDDLRNLKEFADFREYGGAPLLGVKKPIVKAHGSSDRLAIKNGIRQLIKFHQMDVISQIKDSIRED